MVSQEEMKAELKQLMNSPDNLVCADCDDKRPTWASIIVPPPGSFLKDPIGCFCCFQCSGAHRRMGTHICFVRSTNLDEWKEKELAAMKNGGNELINGLFEAKLTQKQKATVRPDNHTDLDERSSYIFDKYQHRKWYSEEVYKKIKMREKADAALAKRQTANKAAMEDDFFAARTAKNGSIGTPTGDEHFATKSKKDEEWWKDDGNIEPKCGKSAESSKTNSNRSGKNFDFLGDRRQLLSSLQVESTGLGIDNGSTPSQLKPKSPRGKQRDRRKGPSPSPIPREEKRMISRKPPGLAKSATSSCSGESVDSNIPSSSRLLRKAAPPRAASGPMANLMESLNASSNSVSSKNSRKIKTVTPRLGRSKSMEESTERRSRSSSVKKSRGAARKNRALVASLYDGTLMDSISTGMASVDTIDDASAKHSLRRRCGDDERRPKSSRSVSRDDRSQASTNRHRSSSRKKRDPRKKRDATSGSLSRTPSPDLTHDSRRRGLPSNAPPSSPRVAPIKMKRIPRDKPNRPEAL